MAAAVAALPGAEPAAVPDEASTASALVGERLAALLGRRVAEVEGAVAVATALAERTGVELREEVQRATDALAGELERVASTVEGAGAVDASLLASGLDGVHRRIDAVTRELRAELASRGSGESPYRSPYGERLAETLGRRLARLEATMEVTARLVERTGAEVRDELADVAAAGEFRRRALAEEVADVSARLEAVEGRTGEDLADLAALRVELRALEVRLADELDGIREGLPTPGAPAAGHELALHELGARLQVVEGDRDALTAQLVYASETWAAERVALHERVAELAARIVTGPVPSPQPGEEAVWPTARAFDQLRIAVEGLRMRLAYHEKAVAELLQGRDADDRIDDLERLLRRAESARASVAPAADTLVERLERVAALMDERLGPPGVDD